MGALPPHIATADEPIPALSLHPNECDLPDMRAAVPIEQMVEWLHVLDDDAVGYLALWRNLIASVGNSLSLIIDHNGVCRLCLGGPVDPQMRHRSRWTHFLIEDLDRQEERRDLLVQQLYDEGRYSDNRPTDPAATTRAVRDFLRCGGRILIDPQGRLGTGGRIPEAYLTGTEQEAAECLRASRAYFEACRRWHSAPQIKRAVRMLGASTNNGWHVLKGKAVAPAPDMVTA